MDREAPRHPQTFIDELKSKTFAKPEDRAVCHELYYDLIDDTAWSKKLSLSFLKWQPSMNRNLVKLLPMYTRCVELIFDYSKVLCCAKGGHPRPYVTLILTIPAPAWSTQSSRLQRLCKL